MGDPARLVFKLSGRIPRIASAEIRQFFRRDMDGGGGKIGKSAGVIRVGMRQKDIADISDLITEVLNLPCRRQRFVKLKASRLNHGLPDALLWSGDIVQADARVDQCQPAGVFQQQTVTRGLRMGRRVEDAAIEMVDGHGIAML